MSLHGWLGRFQCVRVSPRCFIVGAPRSGTTLLQIQLARHPQLLTFPETHLWPRAHGFGARPEVTPERPGVEIYRGELTTVIETLCANTGVDSRTILPILRGRRVSHLKTSFLRCLDRITRRAGRRGWLEKTLAHVRYIPEVRALLPSAVFIHILRDGLSVVASLREVTARYPQWWGGAPWSVAQCADVWNRDAAISLSYRRTPGHYLIAYDQFAEKPDEYLNSLWRFLGLEPQQGNTCNSVDNTAVRAFEHWKQAATKPAQDQSYDRVGERLTAPQVEQARKRLDRGGRIPAHLFRP